MSDTSAPADGADVADVAADVEMEPGDPRAREHGCTCSVLANAGYRARREASPLVDPSCRMHALL